jgi:hypothetical protein
MVTVQAFLLCDAIQREQNGKVVLIGLFERLSASGHAREHGPFAVFAAVKADPGKHTFAFHVVSPSQEVIVWGSGGFECGAGTSHFTFDVRKMAFPEAGLWTFEFWVDGVRVACHDLDVTHAPLLSLVSPMLVGPNGEPLM